MTEEKRFEYGGEMRPVESARTYVGKRVDGRLEARIAHPVLRGVTSGMLVWWFEDFLPRLYAQRDREKFSLSL